MKTTNPTSCLMGFEAHLVNLRVFTCVFSFFSSIFSHFMYKLTIQASYRARIPDLTSESDPLVNFTPRNSSVKCTCSYMTAFGDEFQDLRFTAYREFDDFESNFQLEKMIFPGGSY